MFDVTLNAMTAASRDGRGAEEAPAMLTEWRGRLVAMLATALCLVFVSFGTASAQDDENYKVAQGLGVYLGVLPAGLVKGPESAMHGGAPRGQHEYHIIIAVFDAATGTRVENAKVTATVSGLGHLAQNSLELEPMAIAGTVTYGGFIDLLGSDRYDFKVDISVPDRNSPVQVDFTYEHLGMQ